MCRILALQTKIFDQIFSKFRNIFLQFIINQLLFEPTIRFERMTFGVQNRCSTN